ncbi:uncharacterized protein LOC131154584 isoform X2 [Malania oleifera]|uniref:uncharacterized protein LOC131154584 isoform X2 n=1 Tax=Malania oleifera TaxID=397392 RepID=UPI0025ADB1E1|nr:uncharacterized protein LOC131154584 isoform X2 [Malania oleifera]
MRAVQLCRPMETILQFGLQLEQWNREPGPTMTEYNMFGLVPGEDRLFANAILLRLADAFRSGDKQTRRCVVKVFLLELRRHGKRSGRDNGILSKHRVDNQKELLRRIRIVFETGDIESRALALILFGCWADFATDSAEIRFLILSGLVSCHDFEVKASLFAAGRFCEFSVDFASVVLKILVQMVTSSKTVSAVRLAGAWAFANLGCSSPLVNKVYKTCLKLVIESSEEDFMVAMLISLSKVALKSSLLIPEQIDLLVSFLTREVTSRLKAIALKCLHFLYIRGAFSLPVSEHSLKALFGMLNKPEFSSTLQCEALRILHKILASLPALPHMDVLEFPKLLAIVEHANCDSVMSLRLLALRVLIDFSGKFRERTEMESSGICASSLPSQIISLIFDRITVLVKLLFDPHQTDSEVEGECESLLRLLLLLVKQHPDLAVLAMDKIIVFVEYLVKMLDTFMASRQMDLSIVKGEKWTFILSKLMFYVYKFVVAFLENLSEAGAVTTQVLDKVKLLAKYVHCCKLFDCYTRTIYSLLLHYLVICNGMINDKGASSLDRDLDLSLHDCLVEQEVIALECAKKLLAGQDNWSAYTVGRYSACQGAWFTAACIFGQLVKNVKSDSCCCWLKSLVQLAHSEVKIKLFLLNQCSSSVAWLEENKIFIMPLGVNLGEIGRETPWSANLLNCSGKLVEVCNSIRSSVKTLENAEQAFSFQRWLLGLRVKVLETMVDILKFLGAHLFNLDSIGKNRKVDRSLMVEHSRLQQPISSLVHFLTKKSFQLKRLAQEFDLIAISFVDLDMKSSKIISVLALSCSILAFSTGFALFFPEGLAYDNLTTCDSEKLENYSHAILVQNLIERLWIIDPKTCIYLRLLLKPTGQSDNCFHLPSGCQMLSIGCETRDMLRACSYAVKGVVHLQSEANKVNNENLPSQVTCGLEFLLDVIEKWLHVPFQIPKYFFHVRPSVGSELFAVNKDDRSPDGISVFSGFHLSLDICLQLKNMSPDLLVQQTKLYCILYCRSSFQISGPSADNKGQLQQDFSAWETDKILDLNEMLLHYVMEGTERTCIKRCRNHGSDGGDIHAFACFKPNERGQGFSTCLLDVSAFPAGSYRIKWHSCCIDRQGSYWSLLPLNNGPVFTVQKYTVS